MGDDTDAAQRLAKWEADFGTAAERLNRASEIQMEAQVEATMALVEFETSKREESRRRGSLLGWLGL